MKRAQKIATTLLALLLPLISFAQMSEEGLPSVSLQQFNSIRIDAKIELTLIETPKGEESKLVYDLADNDPLKFAFEVNDKQRLTITQSKNSRSVTPIRATLYYNGVENISISRADVKFGTPFKSVLSDIKVDSGAKLTGSIECDDMLLTAQSDSRIELTGSVRFLSVKASMGASAKLRGVNILSAGINASHGAVVGIDAGERLELNASTNGVIRYWGTPKILRSNHGLIGGEISKQD